MAEDKNNEEEKFDFTPEGEGYISLAEARVLAVRTAVETPGNYGRQYRGVAMAFEVADSGEDEDFYTVTLSFRPQGRFDGTPGQEQFVIGKDGTIAVRQVLSSLVREGGGFPVIPVAIGLVVVGIIAAVGAILLMSSSGGDSVPIAAVSPTETPAPTETSEPTPTSTSMPPYTPRPTYTPRPIPTAKVIVVAPPPTPRPTPTKTPRPTATPDARSYYDKGEDYRYAENWEMAIGEYTRAIGVNPNYTNAYFKRGYSYGELDQHQNAINDYTKVIQLDPDYSNAYANRGLSYDGLGQYQTAINDYTKAIQLDPDNSYAYANRGKNYLNSREYLLAIQDFDKTIEIDPANAGAYYFRGVSYKLIGHTESEEADHMQACLLGFSLYALMSNPPC